MKINGSRINEIGQKFANLHGMIREINDSLNVARNILIWERALQTCCALKWAVLFCALLHDVTYIIICRDAHKKQGTQRNELHGGLHHHCGHTHKFQFGSHGRRSQVLPGGCLFKFSKALIGR